MWMVTVTAIHFVLTSCTVRTHAVFHWGQQWNVRCRPERLQIWHNLSQDCGLLDCVLGFTECPTTQETLCENLVSSKGYTYQVPQDKIPDLRDCEHGWYHLVGTPAPCCFKFDSKDKWQYCEYKAVFVIVRFSSVHRMGHLSLTQLTKRRI